jgi:glycosyltransferase involved in cell wall biosynthesis
LADLDIVVRCTVYDLTYLQTNTNRAITEGARGPRAIIHERSDSLIRRVAVIGNHLPRHCGIATFTTHLADAIANVAPSVDCFVLAVNDPGKHHAYPSRVRFEIAEADASSYRRTADYLNVNAVDLVCVQHEFGIFGGKAGSHLLLLLRELRMPVVTTLHTILSDPSPPQRRAIEEIAERSQRLVVMSAQGAEVLAATYGVPAAKIDVIPHGIPQVPATRESKHRLGVEGHEVLLTFGLLSPDKGIEYVIEALPAIVAAHPEVVYIVLGATHPHVKEQHGEAYRLMLERRARQLHVEDHVIFHDRFVGQDELNEFLGAADIYITPYLNPNQSVSGTLAYALGSGRAVISTPYAYARELLAEDRGVLVPWRDSASIATEVTRLLHDDESREAMRQRAARHGRTMLWPEVAGRYLASFEQGAREHVTDWRASFQAHTLATRLTGLPELSLQHVQALTDDTGLLQHATFCVPRYSEGYCLDDNARALLLMARIEESGAEDRDRVRTLATRYLAFVYASFNAARGRFRNFLSYSRTWTEQAGSEDSHGRGLHALGAVVGRSSDPGRTSLAGDLFHAALPGVEPFSSPRAWATTLLGIDEYLHAFEGDRRVQELRTTLADRLLGLYTQVESPPWPWYEDRLTYANAQLPHALIASGARMGRADLVSAGLRSLAWLVSVQRTEDGCFSPVGSNGFSVRGERAALFDQQPIEASTLIAACVEAERVTGDVVWRQRAQVAFDWFLGQNHLHQWLYDASTGGCRDGLHAERPNENQGAESTLAFLLALVDMRAVDRTHVTHAGRVVQP